MKIALIISIFLITPFVVITIFSKYKLAKSVGTVIMAFAVGILLSFLFSFTNFFSAVEMKSIESLSDLLMDISVPIAIPLMLFSSDFRMWAKSLPKAVIALCTGIVAVVVAVVVSFFIFKNAGIIDISKLGGMMTGFYTGGNVNFFAIKSALGADDTVTTLAYTSEMIIMFPILVFLTAGGFRFFRWALPFKDDVFVKDSNPAQERASVDIENYAGMLTKKVFPKTMLGFLISASFLGLGLGLSALLPSSVPKVLVIILTITTLAIVASFHKKIRSLPRTFELGMFFILIFSVIVASKFNIAMLKAEALQIFLFVLCITLSSITLHCILCRIFKVSGDLFSVAFIALLCSPPFVPPIVAAMGNRKVLISGISIGLVGYAFGTYLGVGVAYLLGLFI